jgi:hypothetical protein
MQIPRVSLVSLPFLHIKTPTSADLEGLNDTTMNEPCVGSKMPARMTPRRLRGQTLAALRQAASAKTEQASSLGGKGERGKTEQASALGAGLRTAADMLHEHFLRGSDPNSETLNLNRTPKP